MSGTYDVVSELLLTIETAKRLDRLGARDVRPMADPLGSSSVRLLWNGMGREVYQALESQQIDVTLFHMGGAPDATAHFTRVRTLSQQGTPTARVDMNFLCDGRIGKTRKFTARLTGNTWTAVGDRYVIPGKESDDFVNLRVITALSGLFSERYEWHAAFSIDRHRILLPVNRHAVKHLFKDRDKEPTMTRRAALRHVVSNYVRNPEIPVREHLRGRELFTWQGMDCEVIPSKYDEERLAA